jgi:tyrosyl-tRNA synthetase
MKSMLKAVGVPLEKLEFVLGSSYQHSPAYIKDLLRMSTVVTQAAAKHSGADVVKQSGKVY